MFRKIAGLLAITAVLAWTVVSCGGGKSGGGGTTPQQAAAAASAAQGAASLSMSVSTAAGDASGYLPPSVQTKSARKTGAGSTDAIANIDPRLKDVVDKMRAKLQPITAPDRLPKPGVQKALYASGSMLCSGGSGTYAIISNITTSTPTTTTHVFSVSYTDCRQSALSMYDTISGTITGTFMNSAASTTAQMQVNISGKSYDTGTLIEEFAMNGNFISEVTGTGTAGKNTADGTFTVRSYLFGMDVSAQITLSNVSDVWTSTGSSYPSTDVHTGNGSFGLSMWDYQSSYGFGLTVIITSLEDKIKYYANGDLDEWINGTVSVGWTPDLSQWGCLNGSYLFTTLDATPIHTPYWSYCPTSGTVTVNNAQIVFGPDPNTTVTVTILPNGPSAVFPDCYSMGGGGCNF